MKSTQRRTEYFLSLLSLMNFLESLSQTFLCHLQLPLLISCNSLALFAYYEL